jgi:hypothetical protein
MIRVVHPRSGIPDPDFLPIPDPGSRGQNATGSRIRNIAKYKLDIKGKRLIPGAAWRGGGPHGSSAGAGGGTAPQGSRLAVVRSGGAGLPKFRSTRSLSALLPLWFGRPPPEAPPVAAPPPAFYRERETDREITGTVVSRTRTKNDLFLDITEAFYLISQVTVVF